MSRDPLRTALLELGDLAPPADLADSALARARRDRRRGIAGLVAAVAVLAAAAVTVPVVVLGRPDAPPPAAPPAPRLLVAGYASRDPGVPTVGLGRYELYDRSSAGYAATRWSAAVPSPDRRVVAVFRAGAQAQQPAVGIVPADRVDDPAAVRWIPGGRGTPGVWSPDGRRLWILQSAQVGAGTVPYRVTYVGMVVDARTFAVRKVRFTAGEPYVSASRVVFGPDGTGFAVAPGVAGGSASTLGQLQIVDDRGRVIRTMRVGRATLPDLPFSPDGRLVLLSSAHHAHVRDLATGHDVAEADGTAAGWYDDRSYLVMSGRALRRVDLASGRVLDRWQVAAPGQVLTGVWLAPLVGSPPPGAVVL